MAERKKDGKFAKGNTISIGHGRPPRQTEQDYMAVVIGAVSLDDWKTIVSKAVTDAKDGDVQARKWITSLVIGDKPNIVNVLANIERQIDTVQEEIDRRKQWDDIEPIELPTDVQNQLFDVLKS